MNRGRETSDFYQKSATDNNQCFLVCDTDPNCYGFHMVDKDNMCYISTVNDGIRGQTDENFSGLECWIKKVKKNQNEKF